MINRDKLSLWKADIAASVEQYNRWFMLFAPKTFRETRNLTTEKVRVDLERLDYLRNLTPELLTLYPDILSTLRMMTAPPLARDRLIGLTGVTSSIVHRLETGELPARLSADAQILAFRRICEVIRELLDLDLFPWFQTNSSPTEMELYRASIVIADRMCGAIADPLIRNAQETRQLTLISNYLANKGYIRAPVNTLHPIIEMPAGTYAIRHGLVVNVGHEKRVKIPMDVIIQPINLRSDRLPILIEAKSAGDFTNTNKRRKEEAIKIRQLRESYGDEIQMILFLCGYFDSGYLAYEAGEGLDWVWEHRIEDLELIGI